MTERTFQATAGPRKGGGISIQIPFEPAEVWGDRDRYYVHGTIGGHPYRGPLTSGEDWSSLDLGPSWCRDPSVGPGRDVTVVMRPEGPQLDTIDPAFADALRAEPAARRTFESLATFYRKDFADWIASAKRDETRERRIAESVGLLRDGRTRS